MIFQNPQLNDIPKVFLIFLLLHYYFSFKKIYLLEDTFHLTCGCGTPSAWQSRRAARPATAEVSLGSIIHRGRTMKSSEYF